MAPRGESVNEEMRLRSRRRLMRATVELVDQRGYAATTLADIAERAGLARGLVSYYFDGKRLLMQSATHRLMHLELAAALAELPPDASPQERLAAAIDQVLRTALDHPRVMRSHLALILDPDTGGFVQDPEQQQLGTLLRKVLADWGATDPVAEHAVLRSALMGGCIGVLLPGAQTPLPPIRADLFARYGLPWELGRPPEDGCPGRPDWAHLASG
ncbi:TetR/AcrR family transcriptional regulator; helix-turn-helix transcriptional regulator [Kitasatospora sp. RB6PN24]|uniref:TetR/AcrR family transcriptional regulator n=1 Tax=Kitasatospora humi TaxID=2893891 RepID=UPI001E36468E|nr:TetR/AcrR family transcriptional regulator [Kitasatospora humi]MCC9311516.1 TetR/AcrR family transcriptional regulator; helix-turn-helix transcriptional regulator [Kitasatospora humi]